MAEEPFQVQKGCRGMRSWRRWKSSWRRACVAAAEIGLVCFSRESVPFEALDNGGLFDNPPGRLQFATGPGGHLRLSPGSSNRQLFLPPSMDGQNSLDFHPNKSDR
jgi:hypothetical protein